MSNFVNPWLDEGVVRRVFGLSAGDRARGLWVIAPDGLRTYTLSSVAKGLGLSMAEARRRLVADRIRAME